MKRPQLEHILRAAAAIGGEDLQFIRDLLHHRLADPSALRQRLAATSLAPGLRTLCDVRLEAMLQNG